MKFIAFVSPCFTLAASWSIASRDSQLESGSIRAESMDVCVKHASHFIKEPLKKGACVEKAMDNCALDKKVDDKNFVCPHYKQILTDAFRREPTTTLYDAKSFCQVAETYVSQLQGAHKVPNMGKGSGFGFELSKDCKTLVKASFGGKKEITAKSVPDFWYAICMNQDCAHFLPSRTRWCNHEHQPTHSATVCEAVRVYAKDEVFVMERNLGHNLHSEEVCSIYDDFVEDSHVNVEAYNHVVYQTKEHPVPSPKNRQRALDSAAMKNTAKGHQIRDGIAQPIKSGAQVATSLLAPLLTLAGLWTGFA